MLCKSRFFSIYLTPLYIIPNKNVKNVRDAIKKLTDFNKPVIIKGKYFTITIVRESRNIVVRNNGGNSLKYLEEPYVGDKYYIISYEDTERDERRYFNE